MKHDVIFTNREKIFFSEDAYTKGDVIDYYYSIANIILPHLYNRPLVLNRHPNGIDKENFFQKQINKKQIPSWIKTVKIEHKERTVEYLMVQDKETLLYVANLGCIELNPFHSSVAHLLAPDYMVIDIDPENIAFKFTVEIALYIHTLLEDISVSNFCKTSGGRGLHIYIPLGAKYSFAQSQEFAHLIALITQINYPKLISLERSPNKRQKKIYIDFLRNSPHQTLAAAYCLRPRKHAPVSTPLVWEELKSDLDPLEFTIRSVPSRLKEKGDIFKPVLGKGINLPKSLARLEENLKSNK